MISLRYSRSVPRRLGLAAVAALAVTLASPGVSPAQTDFTPALILDHAEATGWVVRTSKGPADSLVTVSLVDSCGPFAIPRPVIPIGASVEFRWHAEVRVPGVYPERYEYKLDDAAFTVVDTSVLSVRYDAIAAGNHVFTLRLVDTNGYPRTIMRCFRANLAPDTWISGPDLDLLDARFGWTGPERSLPIASWKTPPDLSGTLLSCDSITVWPADRPLHKTFFEIYGDRLYVRSEGDTVHQNSWVIAHFGGSDPDSRYDVSVSELDPALDDIWHCAYDGDAKVLRDSSVIGSAVAFRHKAPMRLDPNGPLTITAFSNPRPVFDPTSSFREPLIASYHWATYSGRAYLHGRAIDGNGVEDESIGNAPQIVTRVENGTATPLEVALRQRKILTFYVNKAPYLLTGDPQFVPDPGQTFASRLLPLNLLAGNPDPVDWSAGLPPPGGPTPSGALRWNVRIDGVDASGDSVHASPLPGPVFSPRIDVQVPDDIVGPNVVLRVELCDCTSCETMPGTGRCIEHVIPVRIPSGATPALASLIEASARPDRVLLRWSVPGGGTARVERRTADTEWRAIGEVRIDGGGEARFEDAAVLRGARYGYRLALDREGALTAGETWVDVPAAFELALEGARPNPARGGAMTIHLSLASDAPARLELLDVGGRRVLDREVGSLGPGRHGIRLETSALRAGIYLARLVQDGRARVARVAVLEP